MTEPEVDDFKRLQEKLVQLAMQKQVKANQNMTKPISAFSKVDYMKNLGAQQQVQQLTKPEQMLIYRNQTIEKVNVRNSECDIRKHDEIAETRYQDKQVLAPVVQQQSETVQSFNSVEDQIQLKSPSIIDSGTKPILN